MSNVASRGVGWVRLVLPRRMPPATAGAISPAVAVTPASTCPGRPIGYRVAAPLGSHAFSSVPYALCLVVVVLANPIPAAVLVLVVVVACLESGRRQLPARTVGGPAANVFVIITKHATKWTIHLGNLASSRECTSLTLEDAGSTSTRRSRLQ